MAKQFGDYRRPKDGRRKSAGTHQRELAREGFTFTDRALRNFLNSGMPELEPARTEWIMSNTKKGRSATPPMPKEVATDVAVMLPTPPRPHVGDEEDHVYAAAKFTALIKKEQYLLHRLKRKRAQGLLRTKEEIIDVIASHDHAVMTVLNQFPHQLASRFSDETTARMVTDLAKEEIDKCRKLIATAIQKAIKGNTDSDGDQQGNEEGDQ